MTPRPGARAVGEERAWGRRLAKRFDVEAAYDEQTFVCTSKGPKGFLDHQHAKPDTLKPALKAMFDHVPANGGTLVVYGWTMAEDLVKLGARS